MGLTADLWAHPGKHQQTECYADKTNAGQPHFNPTLGRQTRLAVMRWCSFSTMFPDLASGCVGHQAAFRSVKAVVNASEYLSQDDSAPKGRMLGIQVAEIDGPTVARHLSCSCLCYLPPLALCEHGEAEEKGATSCDCRLAPSCCKTQSRPRAPRTPRAPPAHGPTTSSSAARPRRGRRRRPWRRRCGPWAAAMGGARWCEPWAPWRCIAPW